MMPLHDCMPGIHMDGMTSGTAWLLMAVWVCGNWERRTLAIQYPVAAASYSSPTWNNKPNLQNMKIQKQRIQINKQTTSSESGIHSFTLVQAFIHSFIPSFSFPWLPFLPSFIVGSSMDIHFKVVLTLFWYCILTITVKDHAYTTIHLVSSMKNKWSSLFKLKSAFAIPKYSSFHCTQQCTRVYMLWRIDSC